MMSGLKQKDLKILQHYARETHNRELYWNYLAQLPGNDGYGLLALGVVRNDNMPGAVANIYAGQHGGRRLNEREWEAVGQQLIEEDLKRRERHFYKGHTEEALNLPVFDVQKAHDITFDDHRLDPNAWTPRRLLEAARKEGGEPAAEEVWEHMRDNAARGAWRGGNTLNDIRRYMPLSKGADYVKDLGFAYVPASQSRDTVDPNTIGSNDFYYQYDKRTRQWSSVSEGHMENVPLMRQVTDPRQLQELNDTRELRLERQKKARQFHSDDPYRTIARSPRTLAESQAPDALNERVVLPSQSPPSRLPAGFASPLQLKHDLRDPDHPGHSAYANTLDAVRRMEARQNIAPGAHTETLAARLTAEAAQRKQGITHVEMGRDGRIQVLERSHAFDEGRRFNLDASEAMNQSVAQSSARWLDARSLHYRADQPAATRSEEERLALSRLDPADQAMFSTIRGKTPAHIGDATVAQAMDEAKRNGIHDARRIDSVVMFGNGLHITGTIPGFRGVVDVTAPALSLAQSIAVNDPQDDERKHQAPQQNQERAQGQARSIGLG